MGMIPLQFKYTLFHDKSLFETIIYGFELKYLVRFPLTYYQAIAECGLLRNEKYTIPGHTCSV